MAFFKWLENNVYIQQKSISIRIARLLNPQYEDDKALSELAVSKIILAITLNGINDPFQFSRDMTMVSILLYTGIRKVELLGLRIQDVDFQERILFIHSATSKSKRNHVLLLHELYSYR